MIVEGLSFNDAIAKMSKFVRKIVPDRVGNVYIPNENGLVSVRNCNEIIGAVVAIVENILSRSLIFCAGGAGTVVLKRSDFNKSRDGYYEYEEEDE